MIKQIELDIFPDRIEDYAFHRELAAKKLKINPNEIKNLRIERRSVDARKKRPFFKVKATAFINEEAPDERTKFDFKNVAESNKRVIVVGSGPAGLFASLRLIELGIKPVLLERGKDVQSRRRDLKVLQQDGIVNPESNYCFGEGGAGTYSDGKLYTRSTKRGNVKRILELFVKNGAQPEIMIDAHPHIGSNVLPKVVTGLREMIISFGGEVRFNSKVTDIILENGIAKGVIINDSEECVADSVILATGHSARDIYYLLNKKNLFLEAKPFAMGVRIEHPQKLIDSIQYNSAERHDKLPAASYSLTCQVDGRGVYSFCMCPGGIIVPSTTSPGELVLNGMSVSRRDSAYANAGFVVAVTEEDWQKYKKTDGVFAGLRYQSELEKLAFMTGGESQKAPAQRVTDFLKGRLSDTLPKASYIPGTVSKPLHHILPKSVSSRLKKALYLFDKKMKGYITEEAQMLAPETRTSSPIRIPREWQTMMHSQAEGLFPAGEGAGYAGGIISAAIDGERAAEAAAKFLG